MSTHALMITTVGFEEIEAMAVADILRRAGIKLTIASLDFKLVSGAHDVLIKSDCLIDELPDKDYEMIILPGGEPGTTNLASDERVIETIQRFYDSGKKVAAICAAPRILNNMGLLDGRKATSYPSTQPEMTQCTYVTDPVVVDGPITTSRGPGTAMAFAYSLVEQLKSKAVADQLRSGMLYLDN